MNWDDEDFEGPPAVSPVAAGNWDDEDADAKPKASWDEEEETPQTKKAPPKPAEKKVTKPASKQPPAIVKEVPLDPLAEKLRKQKLVEESDYQNVQDIFSGIGDKKSEKEEDKIDINTFQPSSEIEFERLASAVAKKLTSLEASGLYASFLKSLIRQVCTPLRYEDCKDISAAINVVVNDKLKAEKEKSKPKKKRGWGNSR